jgi:solute carrier family 25 protein 39/40
VGDEASAVSVLGANFSAGFVAGSLAAAATCPLDVAKTRRQIEVFPLFVFKTKLMPCLVREDLDLR